MQYLVTAHSWITSTLPPTYAKPLEGFNRKVHTVIVETDGYDEKPEQLAIKYLDKMVDDFCELKKDGQPRVFPFHNRTRTANLSGFSRLVSHPLNPDEDDRRDRSVRFDIGLVLSLPDIFQKEWEWEVSSKNDTIVNDRDFKEDIHRVALAVKSATPI